MFPEEKYNKKYSIFDHFSPGIATIWTYGPQSVIKIPMVLVLRVNLGFFLPFPVNFSYLHVNKSLVKKI